MNINKKLVLKKTNWFLLFRQPVKIKLQDKYYLYLTPIPNITLYIEQQITSHFKQRAQINSLNEKYYPNTSI